VQWRPFEDLHTLILRMSRTGPKILPCVQSGAPPTATSINAPELTSGHICFESIKDKAVLALSTEATRCDVAYGGH
jgi:hypothetical protein